LFFKIYTKKKAPVQGNTLRDNHTEMNPNLQSDQFVA